MHKFAIGSFVKHKRSDYHLFQVLAELTSVPEGGPSLYRCIALDNDDQLHNYHESDLYQVTPSEDQIRAFIENTSFSEAPSRFDSAKYRIDPVFASRQFNLKPNTCFLVMPFTASWSERVHKHVARILRRVGYTVIRADDLYGHDVLEDIWRALNESEVVIADTTGKNPNVFYEVGIAHTLGKRTILISQDATDIPFDFRRFRHIIYQDNVDGFALLTRELPRYLESP